MSLLGNKTKDARLLLSLLTPELIEEWNKVIRARRAYFKLDYTTHYPVLLIGSANSEKMEPWMTMDTRTGKVTYLPMIQDDLKLVTRDIMERFLKRECIVAIGYRKNSQKQKFATLHVVANGSGQVRTVLLSVKKGQVTQPFGQFALNDRW